MYFYYWLNDWIFSIDFLSYEIYYRKVRDYYESEAITAVWFNMIHFTCVYNLSVGVNQNSEFKSAELWL